MAQRAVFTPQVLATTLNQLVSGPLGSSGGKGKSRWKREKERTEKLYWKRFELTNRSACIASTIFRAFRFL
jgi:hypothetical protein